jgi:hypothetical protein
MIDWLHFSDRATLHFSICQPSQLSCRVLKIVTTLCTATRTPENLEHFMLFYVIELADLFLPAEKSINGNISWLMHQFHKDSANFTFRQEVKSTSHYHTVTTTDTMRFRITKCCAWPPRSPHPHMTPFYWVVRCIFHHIQ